MIEERQGPMPSNLDAACEQLAKGIGRGSTLAAWGVVAQVANTLALCPCETCQHVAGRLVTAVCAAVAEVPR